jgi:hypothetical protein
MVAKLREPERVPKRMPYSDTSTSELTGVFYSQEKWPNKKLRELERTLREFYIDITPVSEQTGVLLKKQNSGNQPEFQSSPEPQANGARKML